MSSLRGAFGALARTRQGSAFFRPVACKWFATEPDTSHEDGKMISEGGGSTSSFHEAKEEFKKGKDSGVVETLKHHAEVEVNTARDMVKDIPEKTRETTQELKETAAIAGEAIKRDVKKVASKVGIVDDKP